jgi:hypothetical protein
MTALDQWKLRGPVRTLRAEFAERDTTQNQWRQPQRRSVIEFRPDGAIAEREEGNPNGTISRFRYSFDQHGRLLESTFQLDNGPISKTVSRYDESGRITQTAAVAENGIEQKVEIYSYDNDGRKTKRQFVPKLENPTCGTFYGVEGAEGGYGAEGVATITTLYDDRGQTSEALFQNENGATILRVILSRDDARRLIKEESQSGDQPPFPVAQALENAPPEVRASAEALLSQLFAPGKPMFATTYRYDQAGRQIERYQLMGGETLQRTTREFDEHSNPVHEVEERTSGDVQAGEFGNLQSVNPKAFGHEARFSYKYDSYTNWTERIVSMRYDTTSDFQPSNIERREIRYYS